MTAAAGVSATSAVASAGPGRRRWRDRPVVRWLALAAVLVAVVLVVGRPDPDLPLDPDSTGPLGARALVLLLEELGAEVDRSAAVPGDHHDVALLLADRLDGSARDQLEAWVDAGGTLVVAAPDSPLQPFAVAGPATTGLFGTEFEDDDCDIDALAGITTIDLADMGDGVAFDVPASGQGCFPADDGDVVGAIDRDDGAVVAVGGVGPFVNDGIGRDDNAALVAALLAPADGTSVAFLRPPPLDEGEAGLGDLVGDGVRQGLVQLAVAFALYAAWRARRLGRPVVEPQPVQLAASELVVAVGNLLQQAGRHDQAAGVLAADDRRSLAQRLGLGLDASATEVAEVASARTGVPVERLLAVLDPPPLSGADDLVALAEASATTRQEVTRVR